MYGGMGWTVRWGWDRGWGRGGVGRGVEWSVGQGWNRVGSDTPQLFKKLIES